MAVAVKNMNQIDPSILLGHMIFYNIPEIKIKHDELEKIFDNNNISKSFLPERIFEHDAFRRATGKLKNTINVDVNGDIYNAKLNIDEVCNSGDTITRILGRKIINQDKEEVEYDQVAKIEFNRVNSSVNFDIVPGKEKEYNYEQLLNANKTLYEEWTKYHSKDTVRNIINKIVKSLDPVTIIKGAYFIPKDKYSIVQGLVGVINELKKYAIDEVPGIEIIPLLDTVEQRDMINDRADMELSNAISDLSLELSEIIKSGNPIHKKTLARMTSQFGQLKQKIETYSTLLETGMDLVNQQLLTALGNLEQLEKNS